MSTSTIGFRDRTLRIRRRDKRVGAAILMALRYAVIAVALVFTLLPLLWILSTSLKGPDQWQHDPPIWLPSPFTFDNFSKMWTDGGAAALLHSCVTVGISTLAATTLGALASYSMSRFRTGGRNFASWVLSVKFLPPAAFIVPLLTWYQTLGLLDSYLGLILTYTTFNLPFAVWILKGFFDEVPVELDDSALVDGCSRFGVIWRITLPVAAGGLVTTLLLTLIFNWGEYIFALVLTRSDMYTVPVRLSDYFSEATGLQWGPQAALALVAILPIIAIAVFIQRYLVRAMAFGAVKG
jgi:multiple sugar transport system permease protein